ncbi:MAG TPA: flagellar assembly protein FliW [Verrucomicrobiae bacterium]|nr:flagellar assembly protein FliW [Verrucomicrobiae bacterium]
MKCAEMNVVAEPTQKQETTIRLPMGLLGFEKVTSYRLLADPDEAPFAWLRMVDDANLAFLVISPSYILESYNPEVSEQEVEFLGLKSPEDALLFNIVTLHRDGMATANLKGPIVINRHTLIGKQIVPLNAADCPLQHPLNLDCAAK